MTLEGTNTWVLVEPGGTMRSSSILVRTTRGTAMRSWPRSKLPVRSGRAHRVDARSRRPRRGRAGSRRTSAAPIRAMAAAHCSQGQQPLSDGERLAIGGLHLDVIATPGHTADSACFVINADAALLTGDTILGRGSTVVARPDGELAAYLATLHRLRQLVDERQLLVVLPGHGPVVDDPAAKIDAVPAASRRAPSASASRRGTQPNSR